jgi:AhpD family alkylhydroperoxidase
MTAISIPSATARLPHRKLLPEAFTALGGVSSALAESTVGKKLLDLVYLRVSQINGCAYCVDIHARDLLAAGEDLQRVNSLVTWREVTLFTERERAALNWAESLTLLTAAAIMNTLNRIGVGLRLPVRAAALKVANS